MLAGVLTWLDASPARYATAAWIVFAATLAAAAGAALVGGVRRWWQHPALFSALALLSIAAFRWPIVFDNRELVDPDESQMGSGALTLNRDPLYWKSVDGQTRGPITDWPLLAVLKVAGRLDYTGARLVSVLLAWGCVMCAWIALRHLFTDAWARLLVLPMLAVHAFSDSWSFVAYGSEHVTDALVALASALVLTASRTPEAAPSPRRLFMAGLALGAVPFAKLQGAPIAAWVFAFAAWRATREGKTGRRAHGVAPLVGGALVVPSAMLLWIVGNGIWGDFFLSYIEDNIRYAGDRWFSWWETPAKLYGLLPLAPGSGHYLIGVAAAAVLALAAFRFFSPAHRRCAQFAVGLTVVSAFAAMAPGRMFPHYLQLIFFPAGLLGGIMAGAAIDAARRMPERRLGSRTLAGAAIIGAFLALCLVPQVIWRSREAQASLGRFTETRGLLQRTAVAGAVLAHAPAGESLGIWGWGPRFWVETGLVQATRDGNCSRQIDPVPGRTEFRERYMADLARSLPPVFLDAVGDGNFSYHDRYESGHETFGELDAFIRSNYRKVGDIDGTRIYVRSDRP